MKESLITAIKEIQANKSLFTIDEASTKSGVVQRLLCAVANYLAGCALVEGKVAYLLVSMCNARLQRLLCGLRTRRGKVAYLSLFQAGYVFFLMQERKIDYW